VRMVQQARIPSIRQFNPLVSADLEAVLNKRLAGDPAQRYQTARDFGRALNKILFHLSREVSSFDIAQLVLPIWRERTEKKKQRVDRGSIIGSLIDEALFEFTSLDEQERKSQVSMVGASPLSLGHFENVQNWADDLGLLKQQQEARAPESMEVGNLASLEDDPISGHMRQASSRPPPPPLVPRPQAPVIRQAPQAPGPLLSPPAELAPIPPSPKGNNAVIIAFFVVLVLAAAVAVAYFRGLLR